MPTGGQREMLEPGQYWAEIIEIETREGKKGPYWNIKLDVNDRVHGGSRWVWDTVSLSEKSRWFMEQLYGALGMTLGEGETPAAQGLVSRKLFVDVGIETYKGKSGINMAVNCIKQYIKADMPPEPTKEGAAVPF